MELFVRGCGKEGPFNEGSHNGRCRNSLLASVEACAATFLALE